MKVSVIIPVYRVPDEMLKACIDSLLRQTLDGLEFLFVVDGAGDPSLPVLEAEARADSRILLIVNDTNRGVSFSRNRGLDSARGDWVGFVDADDRVEPEMFARLFGLAQKEACDLAACRLQYDGAGCGELLPIHSFSGVLDRSRPDEAAAAVFRVGLSCCTKLFARISIEALRFDEDLTHFEDGVFLHRAAGAARRIGFLNEPLYRAFAREDSAQHRPMDLDRFGSMYQGLSRLSQVAWEQSEQSVQMKQAWGWLLLALSVGSRGSLTALPPAAADAAWQVVRSFVTDDLGDFRGIYPAPLRGLVNWMTRTPQRLCQTSSMADSLLWQQIRSGTAPFRGESRGQTLVDLFGRIGAKVRRSPLNEN